jgi:hypothetical protein
VLDVSKEQEMKKSQEKSSRKNGDKDVAKYLWEKKENLIFTARMFVAGRRMDKI